MQPNRPAPPRGRWHAGWIAGAAAVVLVLSAARFGFDGTPPRPSDPHGSAPAALGSAPDRESRMGSQPAKLYFGRPLAEWLADLCSTNHAAVLTAQEALAKSAAGSAMVIHALVGCLSSAEPITRVQALECMRMIPEKPEGLVPDMIHSLSDPSPAVRAEAALALGSFRLLALEAVPGLKRLARDDPDETVRSRAKDALYNIRIYNDVPFESTPLIRR